MTSERPEPRWYYVGLYGQLGPLTDEQMQELIGDGVISGDTYVWRPGMGDWLEAEQVADLRAVLKPASSAAVPPPPPSRPRSPQPAPSPRSMPTAAFAYSPVASPWESLQSHLPVSDKNRILAGLLNILLPGIGRIYLGYAMEGILQLMLTIITCGIGWLWALFDGVYMLAGGLKLDGYGRVLRD